MSEKVRFHVVTRSVFSFRILFRSCGELEVVKLALWRNLNVNEVIPASAGIVPSSYRQEYCVMPSSFPLSAMINPAGNKPMLWRKSGQCFPMSAYSRGDQPHSKVQPLCFSLIYVLCLAMGYEKLLQSGMVSWKVSIFRLSSSPVCN